MKPNHDPHRNAADTSQATAADSSPTHANGAPLVAEAPAGAASFDGANMGDGLNDGGQAVAPAALMTRPVLERRRQNRRGGHRGGSGRRAIDRSTEHVLLIREPRMVSFEEYQRRPLEAGEVRVQTLYSGISAGTEMTIYRGSNPYAHKRWDATLKLFLPEAQASSFYPAAVGYEEVGFVCEVGPGVTEVAVGDHLYGSWNHRTEVILPVDLAVQNRFSSHLDPRYGIFVRVGAIALNGVLDARINVGETVAVFGAGVVGLLAMALARLSGARVYAVDINPARLRNAHRYADDMISEEAALSIKNMTSGRGADVVIEATGSYPALSEAIRSVAYAGRVVSLGFYQGSAGSLFLGEEFHHNRVQVICSQINAVSPEISNRWDVPRLERTIMALQAAERLDLIPLISQEIPFQEAASGYQMLENYPDSAVQIALTFPNALRERPLPNSFNSP